MRQARSGRSGQIGIGAQRLPARTRTGLLRGVVLGGGPSAGSTANSSAEPDLGDVVGGVLDGVTGVILPSPTPSTKK